MRMPLTHKVVVKMKTQHRTLLIKLPIIVIVTIKCHEEICLLPVLFRDDTSLLYSSRTDNSFACL